MIVTSLTGIATPGSILAAAGADWRTAVTDLVAWLVANNRCFSSGEVAAYLRTYRPDLKFMVSGIGDYMREQYESGAFPSYIDAACNPVYPTQVGRTCNGVARTLDGRTVVTRTPVGTTVFVYAKDDAAGYAHDFEVFIPEWDDPTASRATLYAGGTLPVPAPVVTTTPSTTPGAPPVVSAAPPAAVGVLITGALAKNAADVTASVAADRRLYVPRAAFEAFVALTGQSLRGGPNGDPVYVDFDGKTVSITRTPTATSQEYRLWGSDNGGHGDGHGRIAVKAQKFGIATPFTPGAKYKVVVTATALTITL
jgi:hypothetical protein